MRSLWYVVGAVIIIGAIYHHMTYTAKQVKALGGKFGPMVAQQDLYTTVVIVAAVLVFLWLITIRINKK